MMVIRSKRLKESRLNPLIDEATQLCGILAQSIIPAKKNHPNQRKR